MAITAGSPEQFYRITQKYLDVNDKTLTQIDYLVLGSSANEAALVTDLIAFLTAVDLLSNTARPVIELDSIKRYKFTGQSTSAVNGIQPDVSNQAALTFTRTNPLRPGTIHQSYIIPAYVKATVMTGTPEAINASQTQVAAVIAFLEDHFAFRYSGDGQIYSGMTFDLTKSGKISTLEDIPS